MTIYVSRGDEQFGPYSPEQVEQYLSEGTLVPDDLAWHEGLPEWVRLDQLVLSATKISQTPPPSQSVEVAPPVRRARLKLYVGVAVAVALAWYLFSPFVSIWRFNSAIRSADAHALEKLVDFPSLRSNLKEQLKAQMIDGMRDEAAGDTSDPFSAMGMGLAMAFAPALIDGIIDSLVTPSGLATLINDSKSLTENVSDAGVKPASQPDAGERENAIKVRWAFFSGPTDFKIHTEDGTDLFMKPGFPYWRVYRITLPTE